jgi:hypothetical protein
LSGRCSGLAVGATAWLCLSLPVSPQERPLPEAKQFIASVRDHLQTDRALLSQYTFLERDANLHLSKLGTVTTGPVQVFEIYPGLEPGDTYRRLIEEDGKPRDARDLAKDDTRRQKQVLDGLEQRKRETPDQREQRLRRQAEAQAKERLELDDLGLVYQFTLSERQQIDGRSVIVIDFAPRPHPTPKTRVGEEMSKVRGRAWVSESDYQLVRVDVEVLKDFGVAWSFGKVYSGSTASYERTKINDEVWLPSRLRIKAAGRVLIRRFQVESVTEYSKYRKFSVQTDTDFRPK